jgi:hypothetical protein
MFAFSQTACDSLAKAFGDLLAIVAGVAITLYRAVHSGRATVVIDVYLTFSSFIKTFRWSLAQCIHEIWSLCLQAEKVSEGMSCQI